MLVQLVKDLQFVIAQKPTKAIQIAVVTRNALSVKDVAEDVHVGAAAIWGLIRTVRSEYPQQRLTLLDIDTQSNKESIRTILDSNYSETLLRENLPFHLSIQETISIPPNIDTTSIDVDSLFLVDHANTRFGQLCTEHLLTTHGVKHFLLIFDPDSDRSVAESQVERLKKMGADTVEWKHCDSSDRDLLATVIEKHKTAMPIGGVLHVLSHAEPVSLKLITSKQIKYMFEKKVRSAWNLHNLTRSQPVSTFLLGNSASGYVGFCGHALNGATSAYIQALAIHRHQLGLPATAFAFGPLRDPGEIDQTDINEQHRGPSETQLTFHYEEIISMLDQILVRPEPIVFLARMDRHLSKITNTSLDEEFKLQDILGSSNPIKPRRTV
jgi:hypothetical protein